VLPAAGEADYYFLSFSGNTDIPNYRPSIQITSANPTAATFVFTLYNDSNCSQLEGHFAGCGGPYAQQWDVAYDHSFDNVTEGGSTIQVGNNGTIFIKVWQTSGSPGCTPYTLTISNHT
jgi:hypothetical protein